MTAANVVHTARKNIARLVYQRDMVADLLDGRHVVRREDDRRPLVAQRQYLVLQQVGVDRVETRKRLVEDQQFGFVQHRDDELHFLGHALRQLLDLLVPPVLNAELHEPLLEPYDGLAARKALQPGEEDGLFADLHLLVKSALLRQVADAVNILRRNFAAAEHHTTAVGRRNAVDDADQGRLSGAVGTEQAVYRTLGDGKRYVVEGLVPGVLLGDMFYCK